MTSNPFFSIVTISFNQADFLREAIESVLSQDCDDYEYIVQDPGSTDESRNIISSYKPRLISLSEEDSGPADGLNRGFSKARGKFYLYLNSDDKLLPGALNYLKSWIVRDNSSHDVYSGSCKIIDHCGRHLRNAFSDRMNLRRSAYGQCILLQPSSAISSRAYKTVSGFNPSNKSNWDSELFINIALNGFSFASTGKHLSAYRIHADSITGSGAMQKCRMQYHERMYEKITGLPATSRSSILSKLFSIERKLLNPRDTFQRILGGPILGRYSK